MKRARSSWATKTKENRERIILRSIDLILDSSTQILDEQIRQLNQRWVLLRIFILSRSRALDFNLNRIKDLEGMSQKKRKIKTKKIKKKSRPTRKGPRVNGWTKKVDNNLTQQIPPTRINNLTK